jgi:hypothetical protein
MRRKWVDIDRYFGPDRRRRPADKRWNERRRGDSAGQPPPLGALLRRLRVQMMGLATADDRARALALLSAAIGEAERMGMSECADALKHADHALRLGAGRDVRAADARISDAITLAAAAR